MNVSKMRNRILALAAAGASALWMAPVMPAQGTNPNYIPSQEQKHDQEMQLKQKQLEQGNVDQAAPKADPLEEAAYKAFYDAGAKDPDKRIQLGQDFIQKYPSSRYAEAVYAGLASAYYAKQNWKDFYSSSDKALAIRSDDVDLLVMVGWVIPHIITPSDTDAADKLDKAERYEKQAIVAIATVPKPATATDEQWASTKTEKLSQAHSALGLVYFRRQQYADAAKELQQATQSAANPDPTDYFVLGYSLQNLSRFPEAIEAYNRCGQMPGALQDRCKQSAEAVKKLAAQPK